MVLALMLTCYGTLNSPLPLWLQFTNVKSYHSLNIAPANLVLVQKLLIFPGILCGHVHSCFTGKGTGLGKLKD